LQAYPLLYILRRGYDRFGERIVSEERKREREKKTERGKKNNNEEMV
jgi:hypothetical protein